MKRCNKRKARAMTMAKQKKAVARRITEESNAPPPAITIFVEIGSEEIQVAQASSKDELLRQLYAFRLETEPITREDDLEDDEGDEYDDGHDWYLGRLLTFYVSANHETVEGHSLLRPSSLADIATEAMRELEVDSEVQNDNVVRFPRPLSSAASARQEDEDDICLLDEHAEGEVA